MVDTLFKKGTFTKKTSTGTQDITDVGFQPKAVILWTNQSTVETFTEHCSVSYGFSDGTNDMVVCSASEDNQATSDSRGVVYDDAIMLILDGAAFTNVGQATLDSFLVNGFRLNWSVANATGYVIHYIAIGGSDITNVKAGTKNVTATGTGNQAYTGVGFQPDFLLTANYGISSITAPQSTPVNHAGIGLSAMKSSSARWAVTTCSENGRTTMDTWRYQRTDKCYTMLINSTGALDVEADFVSFDSDGWTWNYTAFPGGAAAAVDDFIYLAIKGGVWDVGNATAPTSNTTTTINTDAVATFKGMQLVSVQNTANSSIVAHNALAIGGCDSSNNQGVITYYDTDAAADSIIAKRQNDNNCMYMMVANATATSSTVLDVGTGTAAAHSLGIAWTNTDASARQFVYWALSEPLSQVSTTKTHKYNTIAQVTTTKTHKYNTIAQVVATKTHKYNTISSVSTTKTHKWNTIIQVSTTKTHKYDVVAEELTQVETEKTHKYNVLALVETTKTHKYNTIGLVEATKTHKYNTIATVSTTKTHKYNTLVSVSTTKTHKYNTLVAASTTKTHKYHVAIAATATKTHKYNIIGLVEVTKTHKWNTLALITVTKSHLWNTIGRITVTKTHVFSTLQSIPETLKTHVYNVAIAADTTKTHKYNVIGLVEATKTHKYDTIARVEAFRTHVYVMEGRVLALRTHKFHTVNAIGETLKTHKYDVLQAIGETTKTHKFNTLELVEVEKTHIYDVGGSVTAFKTHKWNTIAPIPPVTKAHLYNVIELVETTKTHKYDILEQIEATKTHIWNTLARVTATKTHRYDVESDLEPIEETLKTHKYNILQRVQVTKTHKFDVESEIQLPVGGGSTTYYINIPPEHQVIDVISSIDNIAVANVEIYPVIENTATANIEISEFIDKTKRFANHRFAKTVSLVLPPIIEEIRQRAISLIGLEIVEANTKRIAVKSKLQIDRINFSQSLVGHLELVKGKDYLIASKTEIQNEKIPILLSANIELRRGIPTLRVAAEEIMSYEEYNTYKNIIDILNNDILLE